MPDAAHVIAERIEAALSRIEAARAAEAARRATLERVVEASIADLDRLLAPAAA